MSWLGEHPLRAAMASILGGQRAVVVEVLGLEPGMRRAPPVDVGQRLEGARQEAAPERRVGDEADAQLPRGLPRLLGLGAVEQRILGLHRRDRMHRMGAPDALGPRLRQAEEAHLALLDQPRHRADGVLDGHVGIDPVLIVEVDHVDAEALEARLAGRLHVLGAPVDRIRAALAAHLAELGRQHDAVAPAPLSARPTTSSLWPQPYMSEVSR